MNTQLNQFKELHTNSHPRSFTQILKSPKHSELYDWFINETEHLSHITNISLRTRIYLFGLDKIPAPNCLNCGQTVTERDKDYIWKNHCSKKCRGIHNSSMSREKARETSLTNWGVENPAQASAIQDKMKKTMIERYGFEFAKQSPLLQNKTKNTMMERYGVEFASQADEFLSKMKSTCLERYGVENPSHKDIGAELLQNLDDKEWLEEQNKTLSIFDIAEKYRINQNTIRRAFKKHSVDSSYHSVFRSQLEEDIFRIIEDNTHHEVRRSVRDLISPYEIDIYIPELNIAFEVNGNYWHSELNGKDRNYHLRKSKLCEAKGIQLIHLWEYIITNKADIVHSKIRNMLNQCKSVYARKCTIATITSNEAKQFLDSTHIQGYCMASIKIGIFENADLVGVMTFGKPRFNKKYEYELLRYATKLNSNIVGGFSKILSYFIRKYDPYSIITYSDKTWSKGNVYSKNNFNFSHNIPPAYYYTKDYLTFESRMNYQKRKLKEQLEYFDPNQTEWENMVINGYDRIWNCGNDAWIWQKQKNVV